jgi:hypothetical protein
MRYAWANSGCADSALIGDARVGVVVASGSLGGTTGEGGVVSPSHRGLTRDEESSWMRLPIFQWCFFSGAGVSEEPAAIQSAGVLSLMFVAQELFESRVAAQACELLILLETLLIVEAFE